MASSSTKTTIMFQCCSVSPQVAPKSLPLTLFDVPWLLFNPIQPLFFYNFQTSTHSFTQEHLPNLINSLEHTLKHFFPLAGKLVTHTEPRIECTEHDSVSITIAEDSVLDFDNLVKNQPRACRDFHGLVPVLKNGSVLSVQITVFPRCGISMGFTLNPVAADWRTFDNFLKTWACFVNENGGFWDVDRVVATHDRCLIVDPSGLKSKLVEDWRVIKSLENCILPANDFDFNDTFRATFLVGPPEMERIKKRILTRSEELFGSTHLLLSPYVVACAFVWVCWVKSHWSAEEICDDGVTHYFGFVAGGITRMDYPIQTSYVGNCVSFGVSRATRSELMGRNGIVHAAKAIGDTIKRLNGDVLGGAKSWIKEWKEVRESELHVMVIGSPKLDLYGLDFGWGNPLKIEEVSIDKTRAISLCESREVIGGMEIGLTLSKSKIDVFTALFYEGLC